MQRSAQVMALQIPAPVRVARVLLTAVAISHVAVPLFMAFDQSALRHQIATQHPDFGAAEVARSATIAVTSGAVFHGILLLLCTLLAWKLAAGRTWTRPLATVSQLLSVVFSAVSWTSAPMFHTAIPIICAAQILCVALLWFPSTARKYFA